ncbi:MAG: hypothetical protein HY645_01495 [Acidobacteria bacterium]|nr:hypothetical protein [Acidobacteriota bacterium]
MVKRKAFRIGLLVLVAGVVTLTYWQFRASGQQETNVAEFADPRVEKIEGVLKQLESNHTSGTGANRSYLMTEPDLNSYLEAKVRQNDPKGVKDLKVYLKGGVFTASVVMDLNDLELKGDPMTLNLFKALLTGNPRVELDGRLTTHEGQGTYTLEGARINDMPVPPAVVNALIKTIGKKQDPPFDPTEPFEMPWGIKSVTIELGKLTVRT